MDFWEMLIYINRVSRAINREFIFPALAYIIAGSIVFVFLWWAIRKVLYAFFSAAKKGKSKI